MIEFLDKFGIKIYNNDGTPRSFYEILEDMSKLSKEDIENISQLMKERDEKNNV